MCEAFAPILSDNGRIINLSSVSSTLKSYSEQIRQRFRDPNMTLEDLEQLAQEFEVSPTSTTTKGLLLLTRRWSALSSHQLRSSIRLRWPKQVLCLLQVVRERSYTYLSAAAS